MLSIYLNTMERHKIPFIFVWYLAFGLGTVAGLPHKSTHTFVTVQINGFANLLCPALDEVIGMDGTYTHVTWYWKTNNHWVWFVGMNQFGVTQALAKGVNISSDDGSLYISKVHLVNVTDFMCRVDRIKSRSSVRHFVTVRLRDGNVDGNWSPLYYWSECSTSCGGGVQSRARFCTDPPAAFGGKPCAGESLESRDCNSTPCSVDGNWSPWYYWSECSTSCGDGVQSRARFCTDPPAAFGGKPCAGESLESRGCNSTPCSVPKNDCTFWVVMFFVTVAVLIFTVYRSLVLVRDFSRKPKTLALKGK